jgi:DNA-binding IclR family transcriptional regulator
MVKQRKRRRIGVLTKTLRILELVGEESDRLTMTKISQQTGYDKSTVYRLLNHLEDEEYLCRGVSGAYGIGEKLRRFGQKAHTDGRLREIVRPFLWGIWKATSEAVHLAALEGTEVVYLDALESPLDLRLVSTVGVRSEYYRTALGKAMAAFQPEAAREALIAATRFKAYTIYTITTPERLREELNAVRERGFAVDQEEGHLGVRCVGTPIFGNDGAVVGAMSISGPISRITPERVPPLGQALQDAAREISTILRGRSAEAS